MECNMDDLMQWIQNSLGDDAWRKLHENTKTDLLTSIAFCKAFESYDDTIDYASSIIPIMKSLEYELRIQFYDPYLKYIESRFSPEEYASEILQDKDKGDFEKAAEWKRAILSYNGGLSFVAFDSNRFFTLGDFIFTVSNGNIAEPKIDRPFLNYCREVIFENKDVSNNKIRKWIHGIILGVRILQKVRNESAHGGIIQNKKDADKVINNVICAEKLLATIKHPDFLR